MKLILVLTILKLFATSNGAAHATTAPQDHHHNTDFDLLIFAQIWPTTDCIEWKERNKHNTCTQIPSDTWTVHGIWPTRFGEIGPLFCKDIPFNPCALKPILKSLEQHWTNVHANAEEDSFWEHEWKKHGTCASNISNLNTELKYFTQGVRFNMKYPLYRYLAEAQIYPGNSHSFDEFFNAIKSKIGGRNPAIQCQFDHETHKHIISQINICLDKNLELTDCDKIKGGLNHGCPTHNGAKIFYPRKADPNMMTLTREQAFLGFAIGCLLVMLLFSLEEMFCRKSLHNGEVDAHRTFVQIRYPSRNQMELIEQKSLLP